MKILIICEFSGVVRDSFRARGHDAWSCDLLPAEGKFLDYHFQMDAFKLMKMKSEKWDIIIMHPPCTYTATSGNRWYHDSPLRKEGAKFCKDLWEEANIICNKVVLEQPKTIMQQYIGKRSQVIHPWQFGHGETKETWLWIKGLPLLQPTNIVDGREQRVWKMSPTKIKEDRQKARSITYPGIGKAMAKQWG